MDVEIIYISEHDKSTSQAQESLASWKEHGWNAKLVKGVTPNTIDHNKFPYSELKNGRLEKYKKDNRTKYLTKKSCFFNHLLFANRVIEKDQPMIFAEHDSLCVAEYKKFDFKDVCCLNIEYAFEKPTALSHIDFDYTSLETGLRRFPKNYPLKYFYKSIYKGYSMIPGTAAYAMSPKAARKLLNIVATHGLEQSDFIINEYNFVLEYIYPSIAKFNSQNLKTSHGI